MWIPKVCRDTSLLFTEYWGSKAANWLGRCTTVTGEIRALEHARTCFEIDDSSTYAQQQVVYHITKKQKTV